MRLPHHLKPLKVAAKYLRSIVDPTDNEAILYMLNAPKRGIGKRSIEQFQEISKDNQFSLFEAFKSGHVLKSGSNQESAVEQLIHLIMDYQKNWDEILTDPETKKKH